MKGCDIFKVILQSPAQITQPCKRLRQKQCSLPCIVDICGHYFLFFFDLDVSKSKHYIFHSQIMKETKYSIF